MIRKTCRIILVLMMMIRLVLTNKNKVAMNLAKMAQQKAKSCLKRTADLMPQVCSKTSGLKDSVFKQASDSISKIKSGPAAAAGHDKSKVIDVGKRGAIKSNAADVAVAENKEKKKELFEDLLAHMKVPKHK